MEETICSNCKLQGKGFVQYWSMKCGCGCSEFVNICETCAKEHARSDCFPTETESPCFICGFFKCKQNICDPSQH